MIAVQTDIRRRSSQPSRQGTLPQPSETRHADAAKGPSFSTLAKAKKKKETPGNTPRHSDVTVIRVAQINDPAELYWRSGGPTTGVTQGDWPLWRRSRTRADAGRRYCGRPAASEKPSKKRWRYFHTASYRTEMK